MYLLEIAPSVFLVRDIPRNSASESALLHYETWPSVPWVLQAIGQGWKPD